MFKINLIIFKNNLFYIHDLFIVSFDLNGNQIFEWMLVISSEPF